MKYLRLFKEELDPQTYKNAADGLLKFGNKFKNRADKLHTWAKKIENEKNKSNMPPVDKIDYYKYNSSIIKDSYVVDNSIAVSYVLDNISIWCENCTCNNGINNNKLCNHCLGSGFKNDMNYKSITNNFNDPKITSMTIHLTFLFESLFVKNKTGFVSKMMDIKITKIDNTNYNTIYKFYYKTYNSGEVPTQNLFVDRKDAVHFKKFLIDLYPNLKKFILPLRINELYG